MGQAKRTHRGPGATGWAGRVLAVVAAAATVAGCGVSRGTSGGVTVIRAPGSLGRASGGPIRPRGPDWPTLLHGASHFGASSVPGPTGALIRWQRRLEGPIVAAPTAVGNVVYAASGGGVLHAIDLHTGRDEWTFDGRGQSGSDLSTGPTVLPDGTILWPGPRSRVFALSPQGRLRWTLTLADQALTPVIDVADGELVVADISGSLSAYRLGSRAATPRRVWTRKLGTASYGNPAVGADGTIYETADASLFAVAADGRTRWQVQTTQPVEVSAAIADDGTVVFGSNDRHE